MALIRRDMSNSNASGQTVITFNKPALTAQGDLILLHASIYAATTQPTITTLAGWTLVEKVAIDDGAGNMMTAVLYRKIAGASETNTFTFTFTGPATVNYATSSISLYIVDSTTPIDAEGSSNNADTTPTTNASPSIVASYPDSYLLLWFSSSSAAQWTPPSGTTELQDSRNTGISEEMCFVQLGQAGPTQGYIATASVAGMMIAQACIPKEKQDTRRPHIKIAGVSSNATIRLKESL